VSSLEELHGLLDAFYAERDWRQFQSPKDIAASLAVEASELQELFLWLGPEEQEHVIGKRRNELASELADVMINCLNLARLAGIDLGDATRDKIEALAEKYPASTVRGKVVAHE
jgi:dCTP diphosphatase